MKKYTWLIILIIVALAGTGVWYWGFYKKEVPVTVETEKPHYGDIANSVTSTGTLEPVDTVVVGSQISGIIQYVYVDFNSKVKKGQLLAQIDKTVLQAQLEEIQAQLVTAKSDLQYQQSNYNRQLQLFNLGAISKASFETAQDTYNDAKSLIDNLNAQIKAAQKTLSYTDIFSPIDGTVLSRNVSVGQTVAASFNTPTLFIIANDLTKMQVQAAVDEADIGNVKTGLRVSFTVDAFAKDVFGGTVQQIRLEPTVSANVVTYTTIIATPNNDLKLKPGMTANVTIYTKEDSNALLVPVRALKFIPDPKLLSGYTIQPDTTIDQAPATTAPKTHAAKDTSSKTAPHVKHGTSASVWVLSGKALIQKKISTGMNDDTNVEIFSGLTADDDVVTGIESTASAKKGASTAVRSPFMPQMGRPAAKPAPAK